MSYKPRMVSFWWTIQRRGESFVLAPLVVSISYWSKQMLFFSKTDSKTDIMTKVANPFLTTRWKEVNNLPFEFGYFLFEESNGFPPIRLMIYECSLLTDQSIHLWRRIKTIYLGGTFSS